MTRHRIVARFEGPGEYTVALVRFLTDDQARELANRSHSPYKDTRSLGVYREQFNLQGMTTSKEDVTEP